mgnify:CR=1 FL=1
MLKSNLHTIVALGLSAVSIGALEALLDEHPLPLPCLLIQPAAPCICWPDYAACVAAAQDIACAAAAYYRAPLCIGVMHGIYVLNTRLSQNTYTPAAVVEIAVRVEYGEIIATEVLLNPKRTADVLLGRQLRPNANAEEASCQLVELVRRRQDNLT